MEEHLDRSFRSLMDEQGPPEGDNPFFKEVPTVELEIYEPYPQKDGMPVLAKKMARRFISFLGSTKMLVFEQSARENNGQVKFIEGTTVTNMVTNVLDEECKYKIPMSPLSGFFGVLLKPMGQRGSCGDPVKFIFDFRDMYLAGFFYTNVFYHYEDARLDGIEVTPANSRFIVKMPKMNGGYQGNDLTAIEVGLAGLWQTYDTLSNAIQRSRREVWIALFRIFVTVSETERFPAWAARMFKIFLKNLRVTVDHPEDDKEKIYSINFNSWSVFSGDVAVGQSRFTGPKGLAQYNCFQRLLREISLVLTSAAVEALADLEEETKEREGERKQRKQGS